MLSVILSCAFFGEPNLARPGETYNQMRERHMNEIHQKSIRKRKLEDQKKKDAVKPKTYRRYQSAGRGYFYRDSRGTMRYYDPGIR